MRRRATKPSIYTGSCVTLTKTWVCWDPLAFPTHTATARLCSKSRAWRAFLKISSSNSAVSTKMNLPKRSTEVSLNKKTTLLDLHVLARYLQTVYIYFCIPKYARALKVTWQSLKWRINRLCLFVFISLFMFVFIYLSYHSYLPQQDNAVADGQHFGICFSFFMALHAKYKARRWLA